MPPPRRSRRRSAAAEAPRPLRKSGRLSAKRRAEQFKREGRCAGAEQIKGEGRCAGAAAADDDDGLPVSDEALLLVFSALSGVTADLVRCAATCRRWRRLVSADAAFICRDGAPPRSDPFIRGLALGFFHFPNGDIAAAGEVEPTPPRFVPLSPAATRYRDSFAAVAGAASRVVASRNGYLVLDLLRRAKARSTHAVLLGVCNPVITGGGVDVLPPLRGKDSPTGPYACTVITAADKVADDSDDDRSNASSYLVILLYNRRGFTAVRCYSSDERSWGPESEVIHARIGRTHLVCCDAHTTVVHRGAVFWPRLGVGLPLNSLLHPLTAVATKNGKPRRSIIVGIPSERYYSCKKRNTERLVGVMPDGRVIRVEADDETIRAYCGGGVKNIDISGWCWLLGALPWKWTMKLVLMGLHTVRLRWMGEKSGIVVFTAGNFSGLGTHVYMLDVETQEVRMVATGGDAQLGEVCGYEMDRVTLLASLGR